MNDDGQLKTAVYHKPAAEPYVLPSQSEHPRHIDVNNPYAAVLRAARICSDLQDFNAELVRMDLTLLWNGYPPHFIDKQFRRLLGPYKEPLTVQPIDQQTYGTFHRILLNQPTRRETRSKRTTTDPVQNPSVLQMKVWDSKVMYPRYLYASSSYHMFQTQFFTWWNQNFTQHNSNLEDVQVRLAADTQRTLETFLIQKKTRPSPTEENELNCQHSYFLIKTTRDDTENTYETKFCFHSIKLVYSIADSEKTVHESPPTIRNCKDHFDQPFHSVRTPALSL